jgi:hypothetical protein
MLRITVTTITKVGDDRTPTNTNEIRNIIKKLKTKNSSGYDEIPMKILKISTP